MNPFIAVLARALGVACLAAVLYAAATVLMTSIDVRREERARRRWRDRDYWRSTEDPRRKGPRRPRDAA